MCHTILGAHIVIAVSNGSFQKPCKKGYSFSLQRHEFYLFYICKIFHLTVSKYSLPKEVDWTNDSSLVYLTILSSSLGRRMSSTDFYCQFFYRYFQTSVEMLNSIMPITDSHRSSPGKPFLEQD